MPVISMGALGCAALAVATGAAGACGATFAAFVVPLQPKSSALARQPSVIVQRVGLAIDRVPKPLVI
jgi:hypothetical protein